MGHFHIDVKVGSRSQGKSAVAASAYRSGSKLENFHDGQVRDFSRKSGVETATILAPSHAPDWAFDREELWNRVEEVERRKNAQLYREFEVSLPRELPAERRLEVVSDWAQQNLVSRGMVCDVAVHDDVASDGARNPHAHVMTAMRQFDAGTDTGFASRREYAWNRKELVEQVRRSWADHVNQALTQFQVEARIDHRSLEVQRQEALERGDREAARALDREPEPKVGVAAAAMERKGQVTERGEIWRQVRERNRQRRESQELEAQQSETQAEQDRQQQDDAWIVANAVVDLMPRRKSLEEIKAESEEQMAQQRAQRQSPAERESKKDLQIKLLHWYNHALELGRSQTYLNKISEVERDVGLRGPKAMTEPARAAMQRDAQQWEAQQQQVQSPAGGEESSQQRQAQSQQHQVERTPVGGEQQRQLSRQRQREVVNLAQYLVAEHGPQQGQNYDLVGNLNDFELRSKHDDRGTLVRYRQGQVELGQLKENDRQVLIGAVQDLDRQQQRDQGPELER